MYALFQQHFAAHAYSSVHSHQGAVQYNHSLYRWPLSSSTEAVVWGLSALLKGRVY